VNEALQAAGDGGRTRVFRRAAQTVSVVAVVALLGVLVWDVSHDSAGQIANDVDNSQVVAAYPFSGARVGAPGRISLAGLRGKVVVLNFWESYCAPCTAEAHTMAAVSKQWQGKGVVFVGIDEQDLPGPATKFMRRFDITYPVIADDGPLIGHYGVTGYPETFFIDKHGRVIPMPETQGQVGHIIGEATPATLDAGIRSALAR
jgi:cytochrome c biogenesis protein CcmG, thiol:disulfide interchange protein DsbE